MINRFEKLLTQPSVLIRSFICVRTMNIHGRCNQWKKNVIHQLKEPKNENDIEIIFNSNDVCIS
jgi:hypothetical protein